MAKDKGIKAQLQDDIHALQIDNEQKDIAIEDLQDERDQLKEQVAELDQRGRKMTLAFYNHVYSNVETLFEPLISSAVESVIDARLEQAQKEIEALEEAAEQAAANEEPAESPAGE